MKTTFFVRDLKTRFLSISFQANKNSVHAKLINNSFLTAKLQAVNLFAISPCHTIREKLGNLYAYAWVSHSCFSVWTMAKQFFLSSAFSHVEPNAHSLTVKIPLAELYCN